MNTLKKLNFLIPILLMTSFLLQAAPPQQYMVKILNDLNYPGGAAIVDVPPGCQPNIGFIDNNQQQIFTCQKRPKAKDNVFEFNVGTPSETCFYSCFPGKNQRQVYKLSDKNVCLADCI